MFLHYFDRFHILGTLPVYGYTENKVNERMNEHIYNIFKIEDRSVIQ